MGVAALHINVRQPHWLREFAPKGDLGRSDLAPVVHINGGNTVGEWALSLGARKQQQSQVSIWHIFKKCKNWP